MDGWPLVGTSSSPPGRPLYNPFPASEAFTPLRNKPAQQQSVWISVALLQSLPMDPRHQDTAGSKLCGSIESGGGAWCLWGALTPEKTPSSSELFSKGLIQTGPSHLKGSDETCVHFPLLVPCDLACFLQVCRGGHGINTLSEYPTPPKYVLPSCQFPSDPDKMLKEACGPHLGQDIPKIGEAREPLEWTGIQDIQHHCSLSTTVHCLLVHEHRVMVLALAPP